MVRMKQTIMIVVSLLLLTTFFFSRTSRLAKINLRPSFRSQPALAVDVKDTVSEQERVQDELFTVEELMGKVQPARHPDFVEVPVGLASQTGMYLREEVLEAFRLMQQAAEKDGVSLQIISAFRGFERQKNIWENKWTGRQNLAGSKKATDIANPVERAREILKYSSMPGTSRHHWGTDIDINSLSPTYFLSGKGRLEYEWLVKNAGKYGFFQPYTKKGNGRSTGYEEEKWHWSYLPMAGPMLEAFNRQVDVEMIRGFLGYETARQLRVIEDFVNGIELP